MSTACIAICADDFGLHEGVTRGALALAERGRLNGVGCMVNAPGWPAARAEAPALRAQGVEIGLHLDLVEHPIDARVRRSLPRLVIDAALGLLPQPLLDAEVHAQLARFVQQLGHAPDYIDGHRHVHQLPQVRGALLRALPREGARPWIRSTRHAAPLRVPRGTSAAQRLKPHLIEWLGARALEHAARIAGLRQNRHLLGVYGFDADAARYRAWIDAWLAAASDEDVLMCHPARNGINAVVPHDPIAPAREVEYEVLTSDWMAEALQRHRVTPTRLSRLLGPS